MELAAGKAKISWTVKRALKFRSQRWRRREVVLWAVIIGVFWLVTIGEDHHGLNHFLHLVQPLIYALPLANGRWRKERRPMITSLEDRAQLEHGMSFEALGEREQKEILANYRVGTYMPLEQPDERVEMERLRAHDAAYRVTRRCLLVAVGLYIAGYYLLPSRPDWRMDPRGWLDPPVWIVGIVVLVLVLPQAMWMWMEPDAVGEPQIVAREVEG